MKILETRKGESMAYSSISEYAYNEIAVVMDGRSVDQALSGTNGSSVYNNVADDVVADGERLQHTASLRQTVGTHLLGKASERALCEI
jgi:hypothetical protein